MKNYMDEMVVAIQKAVQIKTVQDTPVEGGPFGKGNKECLEQVLELAKSLGFKTKNLDGYCGYAEIGSGDELVGIIGHLDVVPEGEGWEYPPYSGQIVDGVMWGRGTWDDKGPAIISLYAIKALADEGFNFNKRVRIIFGCNEESGSRCMEHYLEVDEPISYGVSPDSSFPVIFAEKTINNNHLYGTSSSRGDVKLTYFNAGIVINAVPDKATFILEGKDVDKFFDKVIAYLNENNIKFEADVKENKVEATIFGKAAHGSMPDIGVNAASFANEALFVAGLDDDFNKFYHEVIGTCIHGENMGCYAIDEYGPLAFNVGLVNYKEGKFDILINSRLPFSTTGKKMNEEVANTVSKYPFASCKVLGTSEGFMVDKNSVMIQSLANAYYEVTGRTQDKPICTGGGTYAREFKNCVAFGPEMEGYGPITIHEPNEKISLKAIEDIFKIYKKAYADLISKVSFK